MVLIIALKNCDRQIYNIIIRYLITSESEIRDIKQPYDLIDNNKCHIIMSDNNIPVGYMEVDIKDKKYYIVELIEIFPMFRGNSYARDTILELERQGNNVIISHPLSFPQWINIMGIRYWYNKVNGLGSRKLASLMSYSSNGNYDEDKYLGKFLRRLAFDGIVDNWMEWEEYINMVRLDPTIILHEYSIHMFPYEYYAINDNGIVKCKVLYNTTTRPLNKREIFILNILDIQYEYEEIPSIFDKDNVLLIDYLDMLGLSTKHIINKNLIIDKNMVCNDGSILYWDNLFP